MLSYVQKLLQELERGDQVVDYLDVRASPAGKALVQLLS